MAQEAIDADREEWLAERLKLITASEISVILGIAPDDWGSAYGLFWEKVTGEAPEDRDNDAMAFGRYLEPMVDDRLSKRFPFLDIRPGGLYRSEVRPWMAATFDRLALDSEGEPAIAVDHWRNQTGDIPDGVFPVQIKTAMWKDDKWGAEGTDQIPPHYRAQVLWEMEVWDANQVLVPVLFTASRRLVLYRLERTALTNADTAFMIRAAEEFRAKMASRDDSGLIDFRPATTERLRKRHPTIQEGRVTIPRSLARRLRNASRAEAAAKRRKALAQNLIRERLGPYEEAVAVDDDGQVRRVVKRSISPRAGYTVEPTTIDSLRAGKWGEGA
jgi:putative phage-type endonuclease